MTNFELTTDASYLYRPTSAVGGGQFGGTAITGNLADLMRNATVYRETFMAPVVIQVNVSAPETHQNIAVQQF